MVWSGLCNVKILLNIHKTLSTDLIAMCMYKAIFSAAQKHISSQYFNML